MTIKKTGAKIFISILFLVIISGTIWAYRGSAASHCSYYISDKIYNRYREEKTIEQIKESVEKANKDPNHSSSCKYDYAVHNGEIIIYCKTHGSGNNISILSSLSSNSYFGSRFNHTAGLCTAIMIIMGFVFSIIRLVKERLTSNPS